MLKPLNQDKLSLDDLLEKLLWIMIPILIINIFFFQNFWIPSESMEPTLQEGDTIIVNKCAYWNEEVARGDVIVFTYPKDVKYNFIKRVIGLPGEEVVIKNSRVYIDGEPISESYVKEKVFADYGPVQVPEGHYFVLGDNRNNSADSRVWGFLAKDYLLGKAVFCYWPIERIGIIR